MEFSVIIPTYNEEECIEQCLHSIVAQQYDRSLFEIILSDARSTDQTVNRAKKYTDNIIEDDRKGIAFGRNIGAKRASGEILVFVDADVTLDKDFLFCCHKEFSNPSIFGMTGIAHPGNGNMLQRFVYRGTYILVRLFSFMGLSLFPGLCIAYRRKPFLECGGFREDFGIVEDLDLSRRISRLGNCTVNTQARAFVSTRRLKKHIFSTVAFHMYCDIKYLITGKAPSFYPKTEEIHTWMDLWKLAWRIK